MTSKTFLATIPVTLIVTFKAEYAFVTYSPFPVELQGTTKQKKKKKRKKKKKKKKKKKLNYLARKCCWQIRLSHQYLNSFFRNNCISVLICQFS